MLKLKDNVNQTELFFMSLLFSLYFTFGYVPLNLSVVLFMLYLVTEITMLQLTFCLKKYIQSAKLTFFYPWQIFCDLSSVICIEKWKGDNIYEF